MSSDGVLGLETGAGRDSWFGYRRIGSWAYGTGTGYVCRGLQGGSDEGAEANVNGCQRRGRR